MKNHDTKNITVNQWPADDNFGFGNDDANAKIFRSTYDIRQTILHNSSATFPKHQSLFRKLKYSGLALLHHGQQEIII